MPRFLKQFLFALLFIAVFGGLGFWIFKATRPVATCFDKIQNQNEEGVDCGPVCGNICLSLLKPIEVKNSYLFTVLQGSAGNISYDALFRVGNSNAQFGSSNVNYEVDILDNQNQVLFHKTGRFYILPGQTKYIYEPNLLTTTPGSKVELKIAGVPEINWQKLSGVFAEDAKFIVKSKDYLPGDRPGVFSKVNGTISNISNFDFDKVDIVSVLFKNGEPVAAGRTDLRTFQSRTDRFYETVWVSPTSTPDRVDLEANTNVFEDSNFLRKYGTPEKFQQP